MMKRNGASVGADDGGERRCWSWAVLLLLLLLALIEGITRVGGDAGRNAGSRMGSDDGKCARRPGSAAAFGKAAAAAGGVRRLSADGGWWMRECMSMFSLSINNLHAHTANEDF